MHRSPVVVADHGHAGGEHPLQLEWDADGLHKWTLIRSGDSQIARLGDALCQLLY